MPDGVVFLPSFHEAIRELPNEERLNAYDAIVNYGLYGDIINMSPTVRMMFSLMKPVIDSSQNRYKASKENGSKPPKPGSNPRGRPRKNQSKNQTENQSKNQDIDYDLENDSDLENDFDVEEETDKTADSRTPPTKAEVELFLFQNKLFINPDRFYASCEEMGWERIWDWRNLAKSWAKTELKSETNKFYLDSRIKAREKGLIDENELKPSNQTVDMPPPELQAEFTNAVLMKNYSRAASISLKLSQIGFCADLTTGEITRRA